LSGHARTRRDLQDTTHCDRSQVGITTRNRDQASHAQNSSVARITPGAAGSGTFGPHPQSNCSHNPGSVIHGR
jgi:hypothetical protein